jgi:hypothetical protein
MSDAQWTLRSCPRCMSVDCKRSIRANATSFTCLSCHHEWVMWRMPSDAEAVDILRRSHEDIVDDPRP